MFSYSSIKNTNRAACCVNLSGFVLFVYLGGESQREGRCLLADSLVRWCLVASFSLIRFFVCARDVGRQGKARQGRAREAVVRGLPRGLIIFRSNFPPEPTRDEVFDPTTLLVEERRPLR